MPPYQMMLKTLEIIENFLGGDDDAVSVHWDMCKLGTEVIGRINKKFGTPGEVFVQK